MNRNFFAGLAFFTTILLLAGAGATQTKGKDTASAVSKDEASIEALDGHGIAMYDLRIIGIPEIWRQFVLPSACRTKLEGRLKAAELDARRQVPALNLPPLRGEEALNQALVQERFRQIKINAEEFGQALNQCVQAHTFEFLMTDLTLVQRVRAMQTMNQLAGPSPKLLKAAGLSESQTKAYIADLVKMRQGFIDQNLDDLSLFRKVSAGVKSLNKKHFSKQQEKKWTDLTGLQITL